jgi:hypothetical protein
MVKISESLSYPGADLEAVYGLITSQEFRTQSCEHQESSDITVTVEDDGDSTTVTVVRTQAAAMPDFVKKLTGDTVKVKQTEKWGAPATDGSRSADVKVSIIGQPAEMTGTATLTPGADGTQFDLAGDVKVSIPFIGKKIETEVAKAIIASLNEEVEYGMSKL